MAQDVRDESPGIVARIFKPDHGAIPDAASQFPGPASTVAATIAAAGATRDPSLAHPAQGTLVGRALDRMVQVVVCLLYAAILVVVNVAVFYRYVLNAPIIWSDTVAIWMFIWMSMLAAAMAIPRGAHMVVDVIPSLIARPRLKGAFRSLSYLSFLVAGYLLVRAGLDLADVTGDRRGTAVDLPLRYAMYALPVGAALFCVEGVRGLLRLYSGGHRRTSTAPKTASSEGHGEQVLL